MHPQIEAILDEAEIRYLNPEELSLMNQYVDSLPTRLEAYRAIRERELEMMQRVADQVEAAMPQEKTENLERSIKNALLMLRYCAMGMLLNDESFVQTKLLDWLSTTVGFYNMQSINTILYPLLNQQLSQTLTLTHTNLVNPMLTMAQNTLQQKASAPTLVK